ncbi:hypothetical protein [Thermocrinis sp.]|uniref:hypothetical protein n=1 Tax=Thermocrinis sp. TaxID=2024383 RepID=UPI002FDEB7A5
MEPLIFLALAVAGVGILFAFLLFDLKRNVNRLQVYIQKINQENLRNQEEKFKELQALLNRLEKNNLENLVRCLGEYASLTNQQLKTTQKEVEELKDGINKMYKLITEEITDKDL